MNAFIKMHNSIKQLDQYSFYKFCGIFIGIIILCISGIIFYYYHTISSLEADIVKMNKNYQSAQQIVSHLKNAPKIYLRL